ncbi:hypothetical protein ACFL1P_01550 [Patescibacteria group bacterium]
MVNTEPIPIGVGVLEGLTPETLPLWDQFQANPDRQNAINEAKSKRDTYLLSMWEIERDRLPADVRDQLIEQFALTPDLDGFNNYLLNVFAERDDFWRGRLSKSDYLSKITSDFIEHNAHMLLKENDPILGDLQDPNDSYYKHRLVEGYTLSPTFSGIHNPQLTVIPKESKDHMQVTRSHYVERDGLLLHAITDYDLESAAESGFVGGAAGTADLSVSTERVRFSRDYWIVWRAGDVIDAGIPLCFVMEDLRDSVALQEVKTGIPLDLNLAVAVIPTKDSAIIDLLDKPDENNLAGMQNFWYGEKFIKRLQQILPTAQETPKHNEFSVV